MAKNTLAPKRDLLWTDKLEEEYDHLFRRRREQGYCGFYCNNGWENLIRTLCQHLDMYRKSLVSNIADERQFGYEGGIEEMQKILNETEWPAILQIKEKFGTLRVYADNLSCEERAVVSFAESMSGTICEVCSRPGTMRGGRRIMTLCDPCHTMSEAQ